MKEQFDRTAMLLGAKAVEKLQQSHVAIFGIGGVGSFTVEALARAGIGTLTLIDEDSIAESNINRQLIALHSTVGMKKVEAARDRVLDINPAIRVNAKNYRFDADSQTDFDFSSFSYVVDAIDTVTSKLILIQSSASVGTPVISCMGAGNKLDPTKFEVADIFQTSVCPLARVMRRELKQRGIKKLKVVYSKEEAKRPMSVNLTTRKQVPGSVSFVPSVAGLILAGEVIKDLIDI